MARQYTGIRTQRGCEVQVHDHGGDWPLRLRLDLWNHSPTGFEWGYCGSGPAQLALAILADATFHSRTAIVLHQRFKFEVVAAWDHQCFSISKAEVLEWVDKVNVREALEMLQLDDK